MFRLHVSILREYKIRLKVFKHVDVVPNLSLDGVQETISGWRAREYLIQIGSGPFGWCVYVFGRPSIGLLQRRYEMANWPLHILCYLGISFPCMNRGLTRSLHLFVGHGDPQWGIVSRSSFAKCAIGGGGGRWFNCWGAFRKFKDRDLLWQFCAVKLSICNADAVLLSWSSMAFAFRPGVAAEILKLDVGCKWSTLSFLSRVIMSRVSVRSGIDTCERGLLPHISDFFSVSACENPNPLMKAMGLWSFLDYCY